MAALPITDDQWRLLRARMEQIAEGNLSATVKLNPVEVAGFMLMLMDRIDELHRRIG